MTTAQKMRPKQDKNTGTWSSVFPLEQVTEQQSSLFVKKLLAVALSNVTYLRAIFPEYAFGDRSLDGLHLKILRDDSACPGASQIIKWIKGCFDALDKKYLRQLILGIYVDPDKPDTAIETYTFRFSYTSSNTQCSLDTTDGENIMNLTSGREVSKKEIYKATMSMLRTVIVLTQSLKHLPDDVMMTMKLLYYDEVTPKDYEPPGFKPADSESFNFMDEPLTIRAGDVVTPWHTLKMRVKTDVRQFEMKDDDKINSQQEVQEHAEPKQGASLSVGLDADQSQCGDDPVLNMASPRVATTAPTFSPSAKEQEVPQLDMLHPGSADEVPLKSPGGPISAADSTGSQTIYQMQEEEESPRVRCPCGVNEDDGLMVLCEVCRYWQHGICFLILSEVEAPVCHICEQCSVLEGTSKQCTDPSLVIASEVARQAICLYRRALVACKDTARVYPAGMARRLGVTTEVAKGIMVRLEKDGVLRHGKGKSFSGGKIVNRSNLLGTAFPTYLQHDCHSESGLLLEKKPAEVQSEQRIRFAGAVQTKAEKGQVAEIQSHDNKLTSLENMDDMTHRTEKLQVSQKVGTNIALHGKGKKRAVSIRNESAEFDISNSQDQGRFQSCKRTKASTVEGIMV